MRQHRKCAKFMARKAINVLKMRKAKTCSTNFKRGLLWSKNASQISSSCKPGLNASCILKRLHNHIKPFQ